MLVRVVEALRKLKTGEVTYTFKLTRSYRRFDTIAIMNTEQGSFSLNLGFRRESVVIGHTHNSRDNSGNWHGELKWNAKSDAEPTQTVVAGFKQSVKGSARRAQ